METASNDAAELRSTAFEENVGKSLKVSDLSSLKQKKRNNISRPTTIMKKLAVCIVVRAITIPKNAD
jgi:hypothetical protein